MRFGSSTSLEIRDFRTFVVRNRRGSKYTRGTRLSPRRRVSAKSIARLPGLGPANAQMSTKKIPIVCPRIAIRPRIRIPDWLVLTESRDCTRGIPRIRAYADRVFALFIAFDLRGKSRTAMRREIANRMSSLFFFSLPPAAARYLHYRRGGEETRPRNFEVRTTLTNLLPAFSRVTYTHLEVATGFSAFQSETKVDLGDFKW